MNAIQKQKLRKFIKELEVHRGRHTELVSVYVPAGYDLNKIIQHLQEEQGTASNIKDKNTRNNVIDSLERMIRHLRLIKRTPENGLAVFAGNASQREDQTDIKIWSIEPPLPLKTRLYRCDQTFILDLLKEMLSVKETYGLVVIDNREANVGLLRGTLITEIAEFKSQVPGKVKVGGQSQSRYARLREVFAKDFYNKVADVVNQEFLLIKEHLKGILVGGPGPTKETFVSGSYINNELKKKIVGIKDLSYTGEFGLHELVDKSQDILAKEEIIREKQLVNRFFEMLARDPEKTAYGKVDVDRAFEFGAVEILLLSDSTDENILDAYETKAEKTGAKIEVISTDTKEGVQLRDLGGVAAILRFAIPR